ncbi:Tho complex subunit 7-domain-containing protein [Multifurca ochricompacta]|uniref:Tho complex subunit 7-domain-containing protein n=1 Tax=Multifurca ochricompacta TaxID=376703 RepID=A0AAD4QSZ6_9AGAM|nr:Tho complex subunit 7-domain-containing protein [Multifurca ochricompacta]
MIAPFPPEEEDAIIHSRITNDERALRRVVKKFSNYTAIAYSQVDPDVSDPSNTAVEDAREAFLLELSSFNLQLKKAVMVCEAEVRQVEEYYRERQRIEDEHGSLKGQIEQLKTSLEHAQVERRRKIEYDSFAEKINTLPSRVELERSIQLLENDMAAIRADQEAQSRHLQSQRASLISIISDLGSLRLITKDTEAEPSHPGTPDLDAATSEMDVSRLSPAVAALNEDDEKEEGEEGEKEEGEAEEGEKRQEDGQSSDDIPLSTTLNPRARIFVLSRNSAPVTPPPRSHFNPTGSGPPSMVSHHPQSKSDDDIEMGELAEEREPLRVKKKLRREELEEGEASDESSELSDPPDD